MTKEFYSSKLIEKFIEKNGYSASLNKNYIKLDLSSFCRSAMQFIVKNYRILTFRMFRIGKNHYYDKDIMTRCLLVVDMLNDFVDESGALKIAGAIDLVPNINSLKKKINIVIFLNDAHKEDDPEFEFWPKHAIKGQWGAEIFEGLFNEGDIIFEKQQMSCFNNKEVNSYLLQNKVDELVVTGVATEYCIKETVLHAIDLGYKVIIIVDAIAGIDLKAGDQFNALIRMGNAGAISKYACDILNEVASDGLM